MVTRRTFIGAASGLSLCSAMEATVQNDPDLIKAMEAVRAAIPTAEADPARPVYHFHPPANWTNDPNGTIFYKGWHHLFYQLNPFEARIGNQHWGHARSRDLVNWEHLPIAIWPSKDLGERFIYSGCAALAGDGRPRLIYTSIGHPEPEQWMVTPEDDDLIAWKKYPGNPVLAQSAHIGGPISQWRDPFVFQQNGTAYMVCGGGASAGRAQVQLYRAAKADLTAWKHLGPVFQTLDRENRNYECPNLFPLEGKWVMIVSPNRPCEYWVGSLDVERVQFTPQSHGILDPGDSYASNISVDDKGRTILWLWGRTNTPLEKGWASVITMPRILSLSSDGYLLQKPAPEFEALRGDPHTYPAASLETPFIPEGIATDCAEIEAEFTGSGTFGLELRRSQDGQPGIVASIQSGFRGGYLSVGNSRAYLGPLDRYRMRVFLDKCTVEVYVNDGLAAVYQPFTAGVHDLGISVFGQPGRGRGGRAPLPAPRLESLEVWQMRGARFDMEHFHL